MVAYNYSTGSLFERYRKRERIRKEAYRLFKQVVEEVDKNDKSGNPVRYSELLKD